MTDLDVYQPANGLSQYQAGIVMTPEAAKAMDEQVRACTKAVLQESIDYGHIPGTSGDEKTLYRPGAQKLLQWFGLGYQCDRVEVERDDDGRKHGITYKCTVGRRLPDGSIDVKATCEGTADYDESKFYQSAEEVARRLEANERKWAKQDGRVANPTKWKGDPSRDIPPPGEYRADWNALMKRAQKRAIVGAVVDATAAGGLFNTDREEDDNTPAAEDDGPGWYEQALHAADTFTDQKVGWKVFTDAADAHKRGLIKRWQQDYIQNTVKKRDALLKKAAPVEVEDLARAAAEAPAAGDDTQPGPGRAVAEDGDQAGNGARKRTDPRAAGAASPRGAQPSPPQDTPEGDTERHRELVGIVWQHAARLGYPRPDKETDEQTRNRLADIAALAGVSEISSTSDLDIGELSQVADALARCKNRAALDKLLKTGETGDGDD
jgi:hypothetical protein